MRRTGLLAAAGLLSAAVLSCGDIATAPTTPLPPTPAAPHPAKVTITPSTVVLSSLGATAQLGATVADQNGRTMSGVTVRWNSSDTTVAAVDASGLVTALAPGQASISAAADSVSATASVRVEQTVAALRISPESATLHTGDTIRLAAEPLDANGQPVPGQTVRWNSSDTTVAAVDASGLVTALTPGQASISAAVDSVSATASVHVEQTVAALRISPETATLQVGDTIRLAAEPLDANGQPVPGQIVRWSSSDTTAVRVGDDGLVFGWGTGRATVSVAAGLGEPAGSAEITVGGEISPDRLALSRIYHRLAGDHWDRNDRWLTDAPLGTWFGVTAGPEQRVTRLHLRENGLYGQLGGEIALLSELEWLDLSDNQLWGSLPPELGSLPRLEILWISQTAISGEIPAELANLPRTWQLDLSDNELNGRIPEAIWGMTSLTALDLRANRLTGPLSPEVTRIPELYHLKLSGNALSGAIPDGLGRMRQIIDIELADNRFTGALPAGLGDLPALSTLDLGGNAGLSGRLPSTWGLRDQMVRVNVSGTDICAPGDLLEWLRRQELAHIPLCIDGAGAFAYLVQTVQSREFPAPLVADEDALLRVFVTVDSGGATIPPARASFFVGGSRVHTADLPGRPVPIPSGVEEGDLAKSLNVRIPGQVLQPGLEMVVEIDPDGTLAAGTGVPRRIPQEGRTPVDVRRVPVLELTAIPFLHIENPDSTALEYANDLHTGTGVFATAATLLPIVELDVTVHEPVWTTSRFVPDMLRETEAIRVIEGRDGYFMGLMTHVEGSIAGQASYIGAPTFVSRVDPVTIAHELGHAMSLRHTRCGGTYGTDPRYPWPDGSIGAWGYDFAEESLVPPYAADLMGYCGWNWISSYHLGKAMQHRFETEPTWDAGAPAASSLLVWGGTDEEGRPFLKPAFRIDAPPSLPARGGDHRLTGYGADGETLFSLGFAMPETAHLGGASSFVFAVPVPPRLEGALDRISLTGPGGGAVLDRETDQPMSILHDPDTGRVRAILDGAPPRAPAFGGARAAPRPDGLQLLSSRGIPDASDRRGSGR